MSQVYLIFSLKWFPGSIRKTTRLFSCAWPRMVSADAIKIVIEQVMAKSKISSYRNSLRNILRRGTGEEMIAVYILSVRFHVLSQVSEYDNQLVLCVTIRSNQ